MAAARASAAGVARIDRHHLTTSPCLFVLQLPAELEPALIENRFVESRLGVNVPSRRFGASCCGLAHGAHLQLLDTHHRKVSVLALVNSLKGRPVGGGVASGQTLKGSIGKTCCGRLPTSPHPAAEHLSASFASTSNSSRRHTSQQRTPMASALSFPDPVRRLRLKVAAQPNHLDQVCRAFR